MKKVIIFPLFIFFWKKNTRARLRFGVLGFGCASSQAVSPIVLLIIFCTQNMGGSGNKRIDGSVDLNWLNGSQN